YVVSYRALQRVLDEALLHAGAAIRFDSPVRAVSASADAAAIDIDGQPDCRLEARLAVVADGASTSVPGITRRRHEYGQAAIVATISIDDPHRGIAYE